MLRLLFAVITNQKIGLLLGKELAAAATTTTAHRHHVVNLILAPLTSALRIHVDIQIWALVTASWTTATLNGLLASFSVDVVYFRVPGTMLHQIVINTLMFLT